MAGEATPITITGPICQLAPGSEFQASGRWEQHAKYGRQFRILVPESPEHEALLARLRAAGITSGALVDQAKRLQAWDAQRAAENPYALVELWPWLKWAEADRIALADQRRGLGCPARIESYLAWLLREELDEAAAGCWRPAEETIARTARHLSILPEHIQGVLDYSDSPKVLQVPLPKPALMRAELAQAEDSILGKIQALKEAPGPSFPGTKLSPALSLSQSAACSSACLGGISVIYGPPGTGKTRCLAEIARVHEAAGIPTFLAAPTGKAAFRIGQLAEAYGATPSQPARTIHRLLRCQATADNKFIFRHGAEDPLPRGCVIVDEGSMLPLALASSLLAAVAAGSRLVLIGDVNQIRPIEPGQPFIDMIESGAVPAFPLSHIWRQAEGSAIAEACRLVLAGEAHELFSYLRSAEAEAEIEYRAIQEDAEIADFARAQSHSGDSIILCPLNRGAAGSEQINLAVQAARFGVGKPFFRGDAVMQIRNDYQRADKQGIFNGDTGVVAGNAKGKLLVDFGGGDLEGYNPTQAGRDLRLAYAISIHKSQGSEWEHVVLAIPKEASGFLTRQLLYTGMSRARRKLTILASPRAIQRALGVQVPKAQTRLACLLGG